MFFSEEKPAPALREPKDSCVLLASRASALEIRNDGQHIALVLTRATAAPLTVHPLWLRERANDPQSLDPKTRQRLFNPSDRASPAIAEITRDGEEILKIRFQDGAIATLSEAEILQETPGTAEISFPTPKSWDAHAEAPPNFDWRQSTDDTALHGMLHTYLEYGYVVVQNVPTTPGTVLQVARRFGFPRETNFGVLFDVQSQPDATDLAYTPLPLDPHTDNPYRTPVPGIQLLHCLANRTAGGLSTLVDGLAVAEHLRLTSPDAYRCLTTTKLRFRYVDAQTELVAAAPIIELDCGGNVVAINYSPRLDFVPLLDLEALTIFYAARRDFDRALRLDRFERRFRLEDGMLMMFDNRRLLHGRTGFDLQDGLRHLQGCYIDADGPQSLYRVLSRSSQWNR